MTQFKPDEALVRRLSELLTETGLTEIEYETNGERIRVARSAPGSAWQVAATPAAPAPQQARAETSREADAVPAGAVLSPMVGTAYLSSEPGSPVFVSVGDQVKEGQTLLIIEAMKVMNQIPSPRAGKVTQILASDGHPVEYGEPLMVIE